MLFDLQSRGRRTAVKIIYLFLAVLMGGGLLLFGIGTGTGAGGFFDIFSNKSTSTTAQVSSAEKSAAQLVRLHPTDPSAWYKLTYAQYQSAPYDNTLDNNNGAFTTAGRKKLLAASRSWQRYLTLDPQHPNPTLARLMAGAYAQNALNQPANAATAMEIVTQQDPSSSTYGALAEFAYLANQMRKGDLAAAKAVSLAPSAQQTSVRTQLETVRRQALQQTGQSVGGTVNGTG